MVFEQQRAGGQAVEGQAAQEDGRHHIAGDARLIRGISAPPTEPLLAVSEATMPSMTPVPNFSGYLDWFLAVA